MKQKIKWKTPYNTRPLPSVAHGLCIKLDSSVGGSEEAVQW